MAEKIKAGFPGFYYGEESGNMLEDIHNSNKIIGIFSIWLGECAITGKRFGEKYGITQKSWIVGQDAKEKNKYVKRIKPNAEDLVAISDFIEDEFFKNYSTRPQHVITNGIDAGLFKNPVAERAIDVAGAGSLIPLKQYNLFIDVVKELKNHMPADSIFNCRQRP